MTNMYKSKNQNGEFSQKNNEIEKSRLIIKLRELTQASYLPYDRATINQSEYAIMMKTFGISWDELKQPFGTFSTHYKMVLTEKDLRKDFDWHVNILKLAKEKGLTNEERETKLMLTGFLNGVRFFNPELSNEFLNMSNSIYN
ncbi:hypothetical protein bcgnr5378_38080 [Bacillus cereus]|uniref:Uncharacterized protein n=1 Tax=Bacillus cereus TaxID=1396 RepID=A0A161T9X6_BACCE|nr:hypothetical protein [Bacillus cereus]KZD71864.1 hypothetical protein B4088_0325 [Bacillus cereus]